MVTLSVEKFDLKYQKNAPAREPLNPAEGRPRVEGEGECFAPLIFILKYIDFSQKFSSGKNVMLQGIIDSTELISSRAYTQEEFNSLQNVYVKINEITENIVKQIPTLIDKKIDLFSSKVNQNLNGI